MKSRKEIILSICLFVTIILFLVVILLKIFYKTEPFKEELKEKFTLINNLNSSLMDSNNLEESISYFLRENIGCKKYIADNKMQILETLNSVYENPFNNNSLLNFKDNEDDKVMLELLNDFDNGIIHNYSVFNYLDDGNEGILYICVPESWNLQKITDWEIIYNDKEKQIIKIGNTEHAFVKKDNTWKFINPVLLRK